MLAEEILEALQRLGEMVPPGTEIVIAGGAAMILGGFVERATMDMDVVFAKPRFAELRADIEAVATEKDLPEVWMNDAAKAWLDILPGDFPERLRKLGTFGNLDVRSVGRPDLILMKLYAMRPGDLEDLDVMSPTDSEIAFVRNQLERIAEFRPDRALKMKLYLEQGEP